MPDMPYIVTTERPCVDPACPCQDGDPCHYEDRGDTAAMEPRRRSRRAVATLEEARTWCVHNFGGIYGYWGRAGVDESGGTVGPLPDGTVIEVERIAWYKLAIRADLLPRWQQGADTPRVDMVKTEIIDAFNAGESVSA